VQIVRFRQQKGIARQSGNERRGVSTTIGERNTRKMGSGGGEVGMREGRRGEEQVRALEDDNQNLLQMESGGRG